MKYIEGKITEISVYGFICETRMFFNDADTICSIVNDR